MKRALLSLLLLAMGAGLVSCGSGPSNTTQTSKITTRAFISNTFASQLQMIDYKNDRQTFFDISVGNAPKTMAISSNGFTILVANTGGNSVSVVDTRTEAQVGTIALPGLTESMAVSNDIKTGWAAVRNAPVTNSQTGTVEIMDLTQGTLSNSIPVPLVRRIVMNPAGTFMLAFSDGPVLGAPEGQISIIDVSKTGTSAITGQISSGVSRPVTGVFSADGTKAFIVNCGQECGGSANSASVSVLDMATGQLVPNSTVPVTAASTAFLDGNTLYVAGSTPSGGILTQLTVSGSSLSVSKTFPIGDGTHTTMTKGPTNKLFIGANPCSNSGTAGCLSILDTAAGTVVVDQAKGFVTGMAPVPNRNIVYVMEGGELRIYDTTTSAEAAGKLIDITGQAFDIVIVDK